MTNASPVRAATGANHYKVKERRTRTRSVGFPLQLNITSIFAFMLAAAIFFVVAIAYVKNNNSVLDLTERFVSRVTQACINDSISMFTPVTEAVRTTAIITREGEKATRDGSIYPYFISVLRNNPQIQSIYIGFGEDGYFLQGYAVPRGIDKFGPNDAPPPAGALYALRKVDRPSGVYKDEWTYLDDSGAVLGHETSATTNYDPRVRPYYRDAVAANKLVLTDLLVYASNKQPGVTAAMPIIAKDGHLIGVAAANVSTNQISDFLAHLDLGPGGVAVIVDEAQHVVAYPDSSKTLHIDGQTLSLTKAAELDDPRVKQAMAAYTKTGEASRFESNGKVYLASYTPFPERFDKKWTLISIVLEDDFVGKFKSNTQDIIIISIVFLLVSMVLIAFLSNWLSRPLRILSVEIQKIQQFDLVGPIALHSVITEVNGLIHSLNMMKRALRTFGMFIPRDLVRDLVASGKTIELGGQDRVLTIMFTDVADFSSLSEKMPPDALLVHISRHLAAISECVAEEHGTVDKYIGDAVMAFWGAPAELEDHAVRGCIAALKAKYVQEQMNTEWRKSGLPALYIRIGLHTSPVTVGNIGSTQRMSYTAVGDGVNVASRLEGVNKMYGTQICISQSVVDAAKGSLVVRPMDKVAVKGRVSGETVYELVGVTAGPAHLLCTHEQLEICRMTQEAFDAYQSQAWDRAIELYETLARYAPSDKIPAIFIERCNQYRIDPPQDWVGVYKMQTK